MNRKAFDDAVREYGVWLPEDVFLSLFPAGFSPRVATVEDLADELDILTFSGATGTKYRAADVKAALGYA
jgi:hypothetical protein